MVSFQAMHSTGGGGETGVDDDFMARGFANIGAWILGRNMFGPIRGAWPDDEWKGWWGASPPYHVPVFVLTHHPRAPLVMEGGTVFHFVTDGIHAAHARAREAAQGRDVWFWAVSAGRAYLLHPAWVGVPKPVKSGYAPGEGGGVRGTMEETGHFETDCQHRFLAELLRGIAGEVSVCAAKRLCQADPTICERYAAAACQWREVFNSWTHDLAGAVAACRPGLFARHSSSGPPAGSEAASRPGSIGSREEESRSHPEQPRKQSAILLTPKATHSPTTTPSSWTSCQ